MAKQNFLDNIEKIKKLDSENMLGSLQLLSKQVEQIWETAKDLKIPANYKNIQNVVVLGMGGSAIGADLIRNLFADKLKFPVEIVNGYNVPKFVNNKTLIIASSYSGGTEEVIEAVKKAKYQRGKILVISAGGKLKAFAKRNNLPALIFTTENNPCGSPRMGLGYSIVGQLILFSRVGLLKLTQKKVKEVVKILAYYDGLFGVLTPEKENPAKQLARQTIKKSIVYIASEHLVGNAHIATNQMNENAKRMACYFAIPELNHHLMEGMVNPTSNKNLMFVMLESVNYHKRVGKRYDITKKVLKKNNIESTSYKAQEKDKLLEACELLVLGSYVSYYSALLKNIDPTEIPFVDYFKAQMKK